jgi:hypothetical protein
MRVPHLEGLVLLKCDLRRVRLEDRLSQWHDRLDVVCKLGDIKQLDNRGLRALRHLHRDPCLKFCPGDCRRPLKYTRTNNRNSGRQRPAATTRHDNRSPKWHSGQIGCNRPAA